MEPLMPSEIARLVYGYLKNETNEDVAECFLKSSPHLTECYQMFKANRKFNIKVNGLNLNNLFDIFGTMCSMINARTSGLYESKTLIEKLQYLLNTNHIPNKKDIGVATEIITEDKCVGDIKNTEDKSTHTSIHIETNKSTIEVLEAPSFIDMISNNISKTKETDTINNDTKMTIKNNPCLSSTSQLLNPNELLNTPNFSKIDDKESPQFKINKHTCSTPMNKIDEPKQNNESTLQFGPKNNQYSFNQPEYQQISDAISQSTPELSKEDKYIKDNSIVIDTGELVDTFLNDQSLLEKIANTINKSIEIQKDVGQEDNILDPPTLEKALDSTQSDPQIKNVLDEFLVFNVDNNTDDNKNKQDNCIKSRLRSAKKKDDGHLKLKKNNLNTPKNIVFANDDCKNIDKNITLINESTIKSTLFENYKLLSNHVILQPNNYNAGQSHFNHISSEIEPEQEDDYVNRGMYVKIAPKPKKTPSLKTHQTIEKRIFPKRKKRSLEEFSVESKFRRTNIITTLPLQSPKLVQPTQSIIIEVPNQSSFETQEKSNVEVNITLPEVSKKLSDVKDMVIHDTPDDRLKPPKSKSLSTPRRRSTHIRCLDFSTPQPKNNIRDQARSKLFCDTPKKFENIVEEIITIDSPLPKLQADWGSVNGFESIVKKETKHWDSDIREMVGAGILTSDADIDGRKYRKKKTPRKKNKPTNDKNILLLEEQNKSNISTKENKSISDETNKTNISVNSANSDRPLINDQNSSNKLNEFHISLVTPDKAIVLGKEQLPTESNSLKSLNNFKLSKTQTEFPISLETPNKITELFKEKPLTESNTFKDFDDLKFSNQKSQFSISLETPDKITELCKEQHSVESNSLSSFNDLKLLKKENEFPISLETTNNITELCKEQSPSDTNSLKNINDKKTFKKNHNEFDISRQSILFETPNKVSLLCKNQLKIESSPLKSSCKTQINPKLSAINIKKQENNLNTSIIENKLSNNSINSKTTPPNITKTSEEKESNFLESFNNVNYLKPLSIKQPENKLKEQTGNLIKQTLLDQMNSSDESPKKVINTQTIKHNVIETPYKCDDAVDVPETPISKLIREYDPSKLVTPLPCTPEHYEDSLMETPLTKVFRETSYLNRPPISPFPPTPGNSRSVDTLILPSEQDNSRNFNNTTSKINSLKEPSIQTTSNNELSININKNKPIPLKTNTKLSSKTNKKKCIKEKNVEAKKKQVYETVKVELFGSEISSSSSANELENTVENPKYVILNKKSQEDEKTSGFKPIPKRKLTQSASVIVNGIDNSLDKCSKSLNKCPSIKATTPTIMQCKKSSLEIAKNQSNIKSSSKSKKNMVHFDDPVEQIFKLSTNQNLSKSISKNNSKIKDNTKINIETEPLIGLNTYLNKPNLFYECKTVDKKIKKAEPEIMTCKLNNSDITINNSEKYNENRPVEKMSNQLLKCLNNKTKTHNISNQRNKSFQIPNCEQSMISNVKTIDQSFNSKEINNSSLQISNQNQSDSTTINYNIKNTSCVTIGHSDESFQLSKTDDPIDSLEYLKKTKIYEVIIEDGEREMVYLNLSEAFTFLDIPSELNNMSSLNPTTAPLITNKLLDVTPEIECDRLDDNIDKIPVTSTPKDFIEKKSDERQDRARRSPSFWEDSLHNYPVKYRDDKYWESNRYRKNHRDRDNRYEYNKKTWTKRSSHRSYLQRNQWNVYDERDFRDDSIKDKNRFKHKEDNRRSYHGYNFDELYSHYYGPNRLEDPERFSNTQRMSQNDSHKPNRTDDTVKKATKRSADRIDYNKISAKVSKVEHQRLLKNVDVDDFLSVVHGRKSK